MTAEAIKIFSLDKIVTDKELLEVIDPLIGSRLEGGRRLTDGKIELIMTEKMTHCFKADPKIRLPINVDLVVPDKLTFVFDKGSRNISKIEPPIAVMPHLPFVGRCHAGDILSIGPSNYFTNEGQRWFKITGEAHVSSFVKRMLSTLGVAQNTLWVTAEIINKLRLR